MIGFDTNVLLRLVVEDDPDQWEQAQALLGECVADDEPCLINLTVLCELIWVLKSYYRASRQDQALLLESLLEDEIFEIEQRDAVAHALEQFRTGRADFADYLIGVRNKNLGASTTYTFDRGLRDATGFSSP